MAMIIPFWFKQRQCKAEPVDDNTVKAAGPNLPEAYLHVSRGDNNRWRAALRQNAAGPDVLVSEAEHPDVKTAWDAAFELYRTRYIV